MGHAYYLLPVDPPEVHPLLVQRAWLANPGWCQRGWNLGSGHHPAGDVLSSPSTMSSSPKAYLWLTQLENWIVVFLSPTKSENGGYCRSY